MEKFYLEEPSIERKDEAIEYINEFYENNSRIAGTGGLNKCVKGIPYEVWLQDAINSTDEDYAKSKNLVPASTFFTIRKSDNKIVGMVNLRHYLNEELRETSGHIGYGIRPSERHKGYAKIQLYLALLKAQEIGIDEVMISCESTNEASDRTIQALGGIFEKEVYEDAKDRALKLYWIDVNDSIEKYKDIYEQNIYRESEKTK